MTGEPRGFSRVAAGFSSYDGEFRMPLVLAQGSPIFHSSCKGELGIALESLPLRVDFIHRVEFGEVSGHRVLLKRGPGHRGPTECGTTHEATSGMSS